MRSNLSFNKVLRFNSHHSKIISWRSTFESSMRSFWSHVVRRRGWRKINSSDFKSEWVDFRWNWEDDWILGINFIELFKQELEDYIFRLIVSYQFVYLFKQLFVFAVNLIELNLKIVLKLIKFLSILFFNLLFNQEKSCFHHVRPFIKALFKF